LLSWEILIMPLPDVCSTEQNNAIQVKLYVESVQHLEDWPDYRGWLLQNLEHDQDWHLSLPLLVCSAVGGNPDLALPLAAAWSILRHTAYIADDHLDGDLEREGCFSEPHRLLSFFSAGVFTAFRLLALIENSAAVQAVAALFSEAGFTSTMGLDMDFSINHQTRSTARVLEDYWRGVIYKSGSIYRAATAGAAIIAGADVSQVSAMAEYGNALGVLQQILDDCRDVQDLSRQPDGEISLPVLVHALATGKEELSGEELAALMKNSHACLFQTLKETDVPELISEIWIEWRRRALDSLEMIPQSADRDALAFLPNRIQVCR
jgi:octaprenyl-diphosphate synthase